jgi:hypothetical protein
MVDSRGCGPDEIVLDESQENEFSDSSKAFVHILWRSTSEIFDYLGAVLRYNERAGTAFLVTTAPDATVKIEQEDPAPNTASIFFRVNKKLFPTGRLNVTYEGQLYGIDDVDLSKPGSDYSMAILSMVSTLVNLSAQPTTSASTSQPLRLLPIP